MKEKHADNLNTLTSILDNQTIHDQHIGVNPQQQHLDNGFPKGEKDLSVKDVKTLGTQTVQNQHSDQKDNQSLTFHEENELPSKGGKSSDIQPIENQNPENNQRLDQSLSIERNLLKDGKPLENQTTEKQPSAKDTQQTNTFPKVDESRNNANKNSSTLNVINNTTTTVSDDSLAAELSRLKRTTGLVHPSKDAKRSKRSLKSLVTSTKTASSPLSKKIRNRRSLKHNAEHEQLTPPKGGKEKSLTVAKRGLSAQQQNDVVNAALKAVMPLLLKGIIKKAALRKAGLLRGEVAPAPALSPASDINIRHMAGYGEPGFVAPPAGLAVGEHGAFFTGGGMGFGGVAGAGAGGGAAGFLGSTDTSETLQSLIAKKFGASSSKGQLITQLLSGQHMDSFGGMIAGLGGQLMGGAGAAGALVGAHESPPALLPDPPYLGGGCGGANWKRDCKPSRRTTTTLVEQRVITPGSRRGGSHANSNNNKMIQTNSKMTNTVVTTKFHESNHEQPQSSGLSLLRQKQIEVISKNDESTYEKKASTSSTNSKLEMEHHVTDSDQPGDRDDNDDDDDQPIKSDSMHHNSQSVDDDSDEEQSTQQRQVLKTETGKTRTAAKMESEKNEGEDDDDETDENDLGPPDRGFAKRNSAGRQGVVIVPFGNHEYMSHELGDTWKNVFRGDDRTLKNVD